MRHVEFDPKTHTTFLAGYMDAVGRAFTTDKILYNLTARWLTFDEGLEDILGGKITHRQSVDNWAKDFHISCTDFLGTDGLDRSTFYLIEYICWYEKFGSEAKAFKACYSPNPDREIESHLFLIDYGSVPSALIIMSKLRKPLAAA
ncbi:MAG: hypothetical protein V4673_13550 [Pseudomonadota bacterium]